MHQTAMLKQLYHMMFEMGHVAFAGTPSHFSIILIPMLGKQTLLFINGRDLPLIFIPFVFS